MKIPTFKFHDIIPVLTIIFLLILMGCSKTEDNPDDDKNNNKTPTLSTVEVTEITTTAAISGGVISDDGGAFVTERGVCWSTHPNPTTEDNKTMDGDGAGSFISHISGLEPETKYYLRAYAKNNKGTGYGSIMSFTTLEETVVSDLKDIDGNIYKITEIGNQTWMAENLKTTRYNDGSVIPEAKGSDWSSLNSGAYVWYMNDSSLYKADYGALYNWYVVETNKICPTGWHVPTDKEWADLINFLGGESVAGGKLKQTGTTHWNSPNTGATNESGFTALPAGMRQHDNGGFSLIGNMGFWWSSTEDNLERAWGRDLAYVDAFIARGYFFKRSGYSIRCIKD